MATFTKSDRLCSKTAIENLFKTTKSKSSFPVKIAWQMAKTLEKPKVQVLIIVSKKNFKSSVDRNLLKRRLREAYRKHKGLLTSALKKDDLHLALFFTSKVPVPLIIIEQHLLNLIESLANEIGKD